MDFVFNIRLIYIFDVLKIKGFVMNITSFPTESVHKKPFSPNDFLDYFRNNINDFADGTEFEPYCEISSICQQETLLWNSNNPLGAIVKLDIPAMNDGVVVCADYNNDYWRFMTLEAPWDWSHPVSGTREFGIEQNPDGSYNIYVRGVDRFSSFLQEFVADALFEDPFQKADELWESFQENINEYINDPANGGSSNIVPSVTNRPDWEKVQDVLQGNRPISDLGCE